MSGPSCPLPERTPGIVQMAHGGGGRLMNELIASIVLPAFADPALEERHDGAILTLPPGRLAFTTDSYVVQPLSFPGGDIGSLAVYGTVNDLAMCGAEPSFMSVSLIVEEGFAIDDLSKVLRSMASAARSVPIRIVTGDTKVVERGKGDGLFVNTTGIGCARTSEAPSPARIRPGDAVVLSGDLGRHGVAVMAARAGLVFDTEIASDCAPLWREVAALLDAGIEIHCLRDLTRGGLASALIEIAETAGQDITVDDARIPVGRQVRGACEILGLDPVHVANEGRFVAMIPEAQAERALDTLRATNSGTEPTLIGRVAASRDGVVLRQGRYGTLGRLTMPAGEQLPRIC